MKKKWPPVKAWTRIQPINGVVHFVAINYGGKGDSRWVNLISVLNGDIRLCVAWNEIKADSKWKNGWSDIEHLDTFKGVARNNIESNKARDSKSVCMHPSLDSGLTIPINSKRLRKWTI